MTKNNKEINNKLKIILMNNIKISQEFYNLHIFKTKILDDQNKKEYISKYNNKNHKITNN